MSMFKICFSCLLLSFLFVGCGKDDPAIDPDPPIETPELSPKTEGRIVGAYVTFYESSIPDPKYFTHLFYAFFELYMDNGQYKGFKVEGNESRFAQIAVLKEKHPDLKILISFCNNIENYDNKQGGGFSALAKSEEYRKAFAADCLDFLQKWNLDGVDMDWEFPGLGWSGAVFDVAVDVANHVLLMKQLRETLGTGYLLTYAGYCMDKQPTSGGSRYIDIAAVNPYVDWVNIMAYDLDEAPRHHSALSDSRAYRDCQRAVNAYLNAGIPANKLVLGIPFYGRRSFSTSPGALNYKTILTLDPNNYKIDNWDAIASVPYVTNNGQFYCGYDNARSITGKGEWLLQKGMKGLMYWQYDGDDNAFTLRTAAWNATMKK
ncbi:MAG: glycoside hydrolase family 18 [Prevotellaceae bacterium]|nr:glycoside hydrolase family 18 [Prevotellaceae bacterium]